jgi:hypothetical protein
MLFQQAYSRLYSQPPIELRVPTPNMSADTITRNLKPQELRSQIHKSRSGGWTWEITGLILALAAVVAVIVLLVLYDGHPKPTLAYGLSLNAVIAFFSGIARLVIVMICAEVLQQSKWLWIATGVGDRNLSDMYRFESAALGPSGSFSLVFSKKGHWPAKVAGVVTVAALLFDPFLQQIVQSEPRAVRGNVDAKNLTLRYWDPGEPYTPPTPSIAQEAAIARAVFGAVDYDFVPNCASGECSWPIYEQLGYAVKCTSVLDQILIEPLEIKSDVVTLSNLIVEGVDEMVRNSRGNIPFTELGFDYRVSLPGDKTPVIVNMTSTNLSAAYEVGETPEYAKLHANWTNQVVWPLNLPNELRPDQRKAPGFFVSAQGSNSSTWRPGTYAGIDNPFLAIGYLSLGWDFASLSSDTDQKLQVVDAQECAITFSASTMETSVVQGMVQQVVIDEDLGFIDGYPFLCWSAKNSIAEICETNRFPLTSIMNAFLNVLVGTVSGRANYECSLEDLEASNLENCAVPLPEELDEPEINLQNQSVWTSSTAASIAMRAREGGFLDIMEGVARSLTSELYANGNSTVVGTTDETKLFIKIRWPWITLPICLVIATKLALFGAVQQTQKMGLEVWKSSTLPYLYASDRFDTHRWSWSDGHQDESISAMLDNAEKVNVQLVHDMSGALRLRRTGAF